MRLGLCSSFFTLWVHSGVFLLEVKSFYRIIYLSKSQDDWFGKAVKDLFGSKEELLRYKAMKYGKLSGFKLFLRDIRLSRPDFRVCGLIFVTPYVHII